MQSVTAPVEYDYHMLNRELDRTKSKVFLGNNAAFLGPLMCSLDFVWDEQIETSDTDGSRIRWNPKDFLGCTSDGRVSSLLHELGHVYRMHPLRRGDRCPDIWNIACDIAINRDLIKAGYKLEWLYAGIGPHPEIPHEMEEDIYDYLIKPGSPPMPQPGTKCCGGLPLNLTAGQKQQVINNVVQAAHSATINGSPGDIPGNVREIIKLFLAPKVPWDAAFNEWMTELVVDSYTWKRPNRRYRPHGHYLPSRTTDESRLANLICYQDVSGSIRPEDSIRFNSELKFVWDRFKPKRLIIVQFDTIIRKIDVLEEGDEFVEIEIIGRGGTSLVEVRQHLMDENPTAAVIFSDLQVTPMLPGPTCPILWIAISNKSAKVPFGKIIHIRP